MSKLDTKLKFGQPSNKDIFEKAKAKQEESKKVPKEKKQEFLKRMASDEGLQKEYAGELIPKVDLNVYAESFVSDFFNVGSVGLGDPMWYELEFDSKPKAEVSFMSQHGGTPSKTYISDGDLVRLHPYFIQTPEVHMNKLSLKQGDISNEQKMRDKLTRGMTKRINKDMWSLLRDGLVDNATSTLEEDMQIFLDEDYKNFPETNNIDASAEGGLTLDIFKTLADHFNRLNLRIGAIYVPANRIRDIYDWITTSASSQSTLPESMYEEIARNGMLSNLFGYPVNLVPVHTLDGTEGNESGEIEMWVSTNEPAGEFRTVSELDDVYRDEDASRIYYTMTRGIVQFQPGYQKKNFARIVFDKYTG